MNGRVGVHGNEEGKCACGCVCDHMPVHCHLPLTQREKPQMEDREKTSLRQKNRNGGGREKIIKRLSTDSFN